MATKKPHADNTHSSEKTTTSSVESSIETSTQGLEKMLEPVTKILEKTYHSLPPLIPGIKSFLVNNLHWLAALFGGLGLLINLASLLKIQELLSPKSDLLGGLDKYLPGIAEAIKLDIFDQVSIVLSIVTGLIVALAYLAAYKPLLAKRKYGWNLLYWAFVLNFVSGFVQSILRDIGTAVSYLIFGLIFGLIGVWFLLGTRDGFLKK